MKPYFIERYYICRNVEEFYTNFNVTAKYADPFSSTELAHAIRNLMLKTPALALNFFRDGKGLDAETLGHNFVKRPVHKITVDDILVILGDETPVDDEYFKRLNSITLPMDVEKPLWNLYVSYYEGAQYLVYVTDHTLVDGNCGIAFHQDLLRELKLVQGTKLDTLEVIFDSEKDTLPPLPPTTDKITSILTPSLWYTFKTILKELVLPKSLVYYFWRWTDPDSVDLVKYPEFAYKATYKNQPTSFKLISLSPQQAKTILKFTKAQKVTLSSYLTAIATQVMQDGIYPRVSATPYSSKVQIAMNGRRFYPGEVALRYAFFVSGVEPILPPFPKETRYSSVEPAIRQIDRSIADGLVDAKIFSLFGMLRYVNPWKFMLNRIGKHSRCAMSISNLGNAIVKEGDTEVEDMIFSQDLGQTSHIGLSSAGTPKGGINIIINYFDYIGDLVNPDTKRKAIDEYKEDLEHRLLAYATEND